MKDNFYKVLSIWILQILFYFTTVHVTQYEHALIFTIIYVIVNVLFLFLPDKTAFVFFILGTITSVFYLFYQAWLYLWSTSEQWEYIITHFLMAANFFIVYISTHLLKKVIHENKELTERVRTLEHYIGESKLLTRQEFERRQALLINAMNRRNETGVMIYFDFTSFSKYTKESVMDRVASLLVETVRADFDLVAEYDKNTLVILLQNTNEAGADIVMNRLQPKMEKWLADEAIQDIKMKREQIATKGPKLL
ncbi:diguanylate cyclase domain-containing protein [Bacillus cereus group sp. MYBK245-2]|uniref:GGDEF domain-containing protein n=1 Tax=Bacillus pacificus TaxID=2026187 RepID=A0A1Y5YZB0_9BACI|nr:MULTISPECIES: diguanylate cyclase [Bacillus cereus group]MCU5067276.1 GGDEF domain-containing protein [Bacillus pacificus]MCZ7522025.1 diguanylate cyclase [Bacillus pacificus]MDA1573876.1 diguanylate cyclase [Bacillus cereus group sp. TH242-3LC]MED1586544.1 diguanylate cyclase [Bacillus pacificus]RRB01417.1 diguanylate cyclase [Bacillus pacificus]